MNKAIEYSQNGDVNKALDLCEYGEKLSRDSKDDISLAQFLDIHVFVLLQGISTHKIDISNLEKANKLNEEAIRLSENYHLNSTLTYCYRNKASILMQLGKYDEALKYFREALELLKKYDSTNTRSIKYVKSHIRILEELR